PRRARRAARGPRARRRGGDRVPPGRWPHPQRPAAGAARGARRRVPTRGRRRPVTPASAGAAIATAVWLAACHPKAANETVLRTRPDDPVILLRTTPCFGTCPEYPLLIYEDGEVRYVGFRNTAIIGVPQDWLDRGALQGLIRSFEEA